ncbi:hypothetical protein CUMW_109270, partial [Citrus unshiu]
LWTRKEKEIAVAAHTFAIDELRSMVIVDRSMIGSDRHNKTTRKDFLAVFDLPSDCC